MAAERAEDPVAFLVAAFEAPRAGHPFGESLAIGLHMRQCAVAASKDDADPAFVAAALLHDVAYLLTATLSSEALDVAHPRVGARWLRRFFPPAVSEPVRLHVAAKRYLVSVEPAYRGALSEQSVRSLDLQGGPMSRAAARRFERQRFFRAAVALRHLDESAKDPDEEAASLTHYEGLLRSLLAS